MGTVSPKHSSPDITLIHFQPPAPVVSPPLGMLCILSALEHGGLRADLRDLQLFTGDPYSTDETVDFILDDAAPIIGIGAMGHMLPYLIPAIREIKRRDPAKRIILGGPGPTSVAIDLMSGFPWVDYVLCGEAELRLPALIQAVQGGISPDRIRGVVFRDATGEPVYTGRYRRIDDADRLPPPAYHAIKTRGYNGPLPVEVSRGCSHACSFCETSRFWGRTVASFSTDRIQAIIRTIARDFPGSHLGFVDDTFGIRRGKAYDVMDILRGYELSWHCSIRIEQIDERFVTRMAESGCYALFLGVESGSNRVLEAVGKRGVPADEIPRRFSLLQRRFHRITASFIWGFPFETVEDCADSIALAGTLRGTGIITPFHLLSALPSADITAEYGELRRFDPSLVPDLSGVPLQPVHRDMILEHVEVFSSFYHFHTESIPVKRRLIRRLVRRNVTKKRDGRPKSSVASGSGAGT